MANDYTGVYPHIHDVTSGPQDNLVLLYGNSNTDTYQAIAFHIKRAVRRIERVDNGPTVADGDTLGFGYFGEDGHSADVSGAGEEVFRIDTERDSTLTEYGFAFDVDGEVYIGVETGEGDTVNGLRSGDDRDRGFSADDLDTRGGVLADLTAVETEASVEGEPTTALSERPDHGLIRLDSRENGNNPFRFAFKNESGSSVTLNPLAVGMTYEVSPVSQEQLLYDLLDGDRYDRRVLTYGGFENTKPNLPPDWQEASRRVTYEQLGPRPRSR